MKTNPENHIVKMRGITKKYPGVLANNDIDLNVDVGEIHALLGENGAGKSTLMKILYGLVQPDAGSIFLNDEPVSFPSPSEAIKNGIGMVHQHFMLVKPLTVAENIVLGQPSSRGFLLESKKYLNEKIHSLSCDYGLEVDPEREIYTLSVGEQQRVEIVKALYRGARVLILDEPTAVLTPQEVDDFLEVMQGLAKRGMSVVFITHKLREVMESCSRVTVLRDGKLINTISTANTSKEELAKMMVGRDFKVKIEKKSIPSQKPLLSVKDLWVHDEREQPALQGISFDVNAGEILGIAGVEGNGQAELEHAILGLQQVVDGKIVINGHDATNKSPGEIGKIVINGHDATNKSPGEIGKLGIACIPSDRYEWGVLTDFSVAENLILQRIEQQPFSKRGIIQRDQILNEADALVEKHDIRVADVELPAKVLSGGNAQKMVVARELARNPEILLAAQPTRGIDMHAAGSVHQWLVEQRNQGVAILLISTELDEILAVSDRIVVLYEGEIAGILDISLANSTELGLLMTGAKTEVINNAKPIKGSE